MKAWLHALAIGVVRCLAPLRHLTRRRDGRIRSLWAGTPIINLAINAHAEGTLVARSDSLVYETYFVTRAFTYDLSRWNRIRFVRAVLPYAVLLWAICRYDRFHFYCDRGLLPPDGRFGFNRRELPLLRRLGKQVFVWTYGADVRTTERTRALGEYHCCLECPAPGRACVCDDARGRANVEFLVRNANAVFAMGDMTEYVPGGRNDVWFWPVDLAADGGSRYAPAYPDPGSDRPLRVVHAPNHRAFKGTRFLEAAVAELQRDGVRVELVLVEGVPNVEALAIYRTADVVFDQCLIGFHGYFVQEAMALGKPVLCYVRRRDYLLAPDECPIVSATPPEIAPRLRELAADRRRLFELGRRGRRYVERYHTLEAFAERLRGAYRALEVQVG